MMRRLSTFLAAAYVACVAVAQDPAPPAPPAPLAPIKQVQIKAWISETSEQGLRDIGANLTYTRIVRGVEQSGSLQQVNTRMFDPVNPNYRVTLPVPEQTVFPAPMRPDLAGTPSDGLQTQGGAGLAFSIIETDTGTIEGVFRGIERTADVDLISKPELLVIDNMTAEIQAGGKIPYQDVKYDIQGVPRLDVQFRDIGVNMTLVPTILTDNRVQLHIQKLDVTDITRIDNIRGVDLPVFSTRSQTGKVVVPDGQTFVIGGLSSRVVRQGERRVPLIGALPLIGLPFRSRTSEADNTHLLVFVSPTIVDLRELTPSAQNAMDFWRDRRWENTQRIESEMEGMEAEL
jgi:general secretion pathway protein D